jgi:drug/metabolite transporter (DMT)-like permease
MIRGLVWALVTVACWAPMFSVAKRAFQYVDAFALGTLRYFIGVFLLVAVLWIVEGRQALRFDGRGASATVAGLLGITGFNGFVWFGLTFSLPEHGAIIMALQTPLTALAVWFLHGQRPRRFTMACIAVAITGVLLVVTRGDPLHAFEGGSLAGDLLIALGAVCWVSYTMISSRFTGWSPLRFSVLTCIPGGIGLFVVNGIAIAAGLATVPSADAVAAVGWQIAYFAVFSVVLGIIAFNQAVRWSGPLNAMLMLNLIPLCVFTIETALGRSFAAIEIGGAALVIGALVVNNVYLRSGARTSR